MVNADLTAVQAELEERMASLGVERFRRLALEARQAGDMGGDRSLNAVLDVLIDPTASAILRFREEASAGKAGRKHSAVRLLHGLEAEVLAFVAGKLVLDGFAQEQNLTRLAVRIGSTVELEQRINKFAREHKALFKAVVADLDARTDHREHRRRVFSTCLRSKGDDWENWTDRERMLTGLKLIELMVEGTGLFHIEMRYQGKKRITSLETTQRFRDWVATLDQQFEIMFPEYLPCVIPPKDWTGLRDGGYLTDAFPFPLPLVKTRHKGHRAVLEKADLSRVMQGVNLIQRTPWAIEKRTLAVAQALLAEGGTLAGLPPMADDPLPSKPVDIDTNEEARKAWRRAAAQVHVANRAHTGRRVQAIKAVEIAKEYADYPAIYFPYQLDFRGRVYAVPQILNPQGNDLAKGLLVFAEGDPIDSVEAAEWFLIHGANSYGIDKVSFKERIQWVRDNAGRIVASAKDPLDYRWWMEADSPFVFLTWCFEYADYLKANAEGRYFVSRVPIAMDGSCNGLQHYSAMLRDPVAGKAVNLVPSDKPQDIYGEVAKVVMDMLYRTAMAEHLPDAVFATADDRKEWELADRWGAFGIDRKITKRPVMVLPYGGTLNSCQKYVYEAVVARGNHGFADEDLHAACNWLGGRVWEAIGRVVVSARIAMGWLQDCVRTAPPSSRDLTWQTPSGFVVLQAYPKMKASLVETVLLGDRFRPSLNEAVEDTIDTRRQVNGVAPNFVHSMDAAVLILTVVAAGEVGISKFAMIHDSYGTTAAFAPVLARELRSAFVEMYSGRNVLDDFARDIDPQGPQHGQPSIPALGGLDLEEVRRSPYFFA